MNRTIYVSGYQSDRVALVRLTPRDKQILTVDFTGAINDTAAITSVTWRLHSGYPVNLSAPADDVHFNGIDGQKVSVYADAQASGRSAIKCTVTLDDGQVLSQMIRIDVASGTLFQGETPVSSGPTSLTVVA